MNTADVLVKRTAMAGVSSLSSKVTYGASGVTIWSGLNLEAVGILVGIVIAIISFLVNLYYQKKKHNLDVLLAQEQLKKIAIASVDESQRAVIDKVCEELVKQFGNANIRKKDDRRKNSDPNYSGVERRKNVRRQSAVSGDTDAAKALRAVLESTQRAIDELENGANKHS